MTLESRLSQLSESKRALLARMVRKDEPREAIAVVGMACRFPGGARDPESFWRLLRDGRDVVSEIPRDRWDVDRFYDPDPDAPGKIYVRHGGFLDGIDQFDAPLFGISQSEAEAMDPQQRILLEVAWEALESAGYPPLGLSGTRTGVFMGILQSAYAELRARMGNPSADANSFNGTVHCMAVGRLSFLLGLQGPSVPINTSCSSALVATHLACQSLRSGESDVALAGGVNVMLSLDGLISLCRLHAMSPDGRCKAFDAGANGMVEAEGCGVLVLKRLSDARAAGDRIFALVRGSAVNHDGHSASLMAPNGKAQQAVIRDALAAAAVTPAEISLLEAHGTGTPLGDPLEVESAGAVLGAGRPKGDRVWLTSVKTNIGHAEAAAGVAALIKVILSLQHEAIPPHVHFQKLNPHISFERAPFAIPTALTPWPRAGKRRLAGVSSFGAAGTNAHVVLEEAPEEAEAAARPARPRQLFCLSAQTEQGLRQVAERYRTHLSRAASGGPPLDLGDLAFTANAGRSHFPERLALSAATAAELEGRLDGFLRGDLVPSARARVRGDARPKVAFLFSGQGGQHPGMGQQLYRDEPAFRRTLDACADAVRGALEHPLLDAMFGRNVPDGLCHRTDYTQPLLYSLQCALADLWKSWGVVPDAVMGHSLGELAAAYAAGALPLEEGARLVAERGRLMHAAPPGEMASVTAPVAKVTELIAGLSAGLSIGAINGPTSTVISGTGVAMGEALARLERAGVEVKRLHISCAAHSPQMEPILDDFERAAAGVHFSPPSLPLISNLTGAELGALDARYLRRHVREPVRFSDGLQLLLGRGVGVMLEVGPHSTLTGLCAAAVPEEKAAAIASLRRGDDEWESLLGAAGALYARGAELDFKAMDRPFQRRAAAAPSYPFQHRRYWQGAPAAPGAAAEGALPFSAHVLRTPKGDVFWEGRLDGEREKPFLEHRVRGTPVLPAVATFDLLLTAAAAALGKGPWVLRDVRLGAPVVLGGGIRLQVHFGADRDGARAVELHTCAAGDAEPVQWTEVASGQVRREAAPDLPAAALDLRGAIDGAEAYRVLGAGGLEYGDDFRLLEKLSLAARAAVASVRPAAWGGGGPWAVPPPAADACLQALAVLQRAALQGTQDAGYVYLPVKAERVWMRAGPAAGATAALRSEVSLRGEPGGAEAVGDVLARDASGQPVLELRGLTVARTSIASRELPAADWLYAVEWRPLTEARAGASEQPQGTWVLLADSGGVAESVAGRLRTGGARCALVRKREGQGDVRRLGPDEFEVGGAAGLKQVLGMLAPQGGPARGLVHLWPLDAPGGPGEAERLVAELVALVGACGAGSAKHPPRLFAVTRGAQPVDGPPELGSLPQASLWGAAGVLALEHPELWGGAVDLGPGDQGEAAASAVEALLSSPGEDLLAARRGARFVPRLARVTARAGAPEVRGDATYLVTGGLGALGLRVAGWLADRGARHLLLLGRSAPSAAAEARLAALRSAGVAVRAVRADVAKEPELRAALDGALAGAPALRGVVHAAGVLADGSLSSQTEVQVRSVMAPKVQGAWNLHRYTADRELDLFVLFSSASAVLGVHGQVAYAGANAVLDALAHLRRASGLPALSVGWGPWADDGLAVKSGRVWAQWGIAEMAPAACLQALGALLQGGPPHAVALDVDWAVLAQRFGRGQAALFSGLTPRSEPSQAPAGAGALVERLKQLPQAERPAALQQELRALMASVLSLPALESVAFSRPLQDVGIDSLRAVELRNALGRAFSRSFPSTLMFDHPTVESLARYLAAEDPGLAAVIPPEEAAPPPAAKNGDAGLLDRLAELSDEEAAAWAAALEGGAHR